MSRRVSIALLAAVAVTTTAVCVPGLLTASPASGTLQAPAAGAFAPQGEKIAVPGADDCFIYVAAWENGAWVDPNSPPDAPALQPGKASNTPESKSDVAQIKKWLEQLLAQSADMREKTRAACKVSGVNFFQVAVVRDDPKAGPGTAFMTRPVIVVDIGDAEKLAKSSKTAGTQDASLEGQAREILKSYLPVTIIVHEIDHMKRRNATLSHEMMEWLAMDDEQVVASQLENFKAMEVDSPAGKYTLPKLERTYYDPPLYVYR